MDKLEILDIVNGNIYLINQALKELEVIATFEDVLPNEANITFAIRSLNEVKIGLINEQSAQSIENELETIYSTLAKLELIAENSSIFNAKHIRLAIQYLGKVKMNLNNVLTNLKSDYSF